MATVTGQAVESSTKWYVEFLHPGSFYPEESRIEIASQGAQFDIPESAYAYTIYSVETRTTTVESEVFEKKIRTTIPGRVYIGGEVLTLDDLPDTSEFSILRGNMRSNNYERVIRCRTGNYQPFTAEDKQVSHD